MNVKKVASATVFLILCGVLAFSFSKDKPTAALTVITLALAAISTLISVSISQETSEHTEKSLKMTEMALEKAEAERKIRYIKDSFNLFYYPLKDCLDYGVTGSNWNTAYFNKIALNRYLATERTGKQFEIFRKNNFKGEELLTQYIIKDIDLFENEYRKLTNQLYQE
jgi:hypothetical protein